MTNMVVAGSAPHMYKYMLGQRKRSLSKSKRELKKKAYREGTKALYLTLIHIAISLYFHKQ